MALDIITDRVGDMESTYEGSVHMTVSQMIEVRRAISARIGNWIADGELEAKYHEITMLMDAGEKLDAHIDTALEEWEGNVARREAMQLNDEEALRRFMEGDK